MSIIDTLTGVLAPYECIGCAREGEILCLSCSTSLTSIPERCYRCYRLSGGAATCADCCRGSRLVKVQAATIYEGLAKELVWQLKFQGVRSAARIMARCMAPILSSATDGTTVVPVPTATSRARGRGYDQAKLLARGLSAHAGVRYMDCLSRRGHTHQVGSSRSKRLEQLNGAFRVKRVPSVDDGSIILVDDVLTTGATLEAAAAALYEAGIKKISATVFAQA